MKTLLETTDPRYLRRLVRELNSAGIADGFYAPVACHNVRCNRARLRGAAIECRSGMTEPAWFKPSKLAFSDPYGREITARRHL